MLSFQAKPLENPFVRYYILWSFLFFSAFFVSKGTVPLTVSDWLVIAFFILLYPLVVRYFSARQSCLDRLTLWSVGCALGLLCCAAGLIIYCSPLSDWNAHRLAWVFSQTYHYQLYYPQGEGPILARMYGPLAPLFYFAVTFFRTPTVAIVAASFLTAIFFFLPAVLFLRHRYGKEKNLFLLGVTLFAFMTFETRSLSYVAFQIHADTPAMFWISMAAFMLLVAKKSLWLGLAGSSLCLVLGVWTKQTMFPAVGALFLWVFLWRKEKICLRYFLVFVASGLVLSAFFVKVYGFQDLFYNMIFIPSHQSLRVQAGWIPALAGAFADFASRIFVQAIILLVCWKGAARLLSVKHRTAPLLSLSFLFVLWFLPFSIVMYLKQWSDANHFAPAAYFLSLAAIIFLLEKMRSQGFFSNNCTFYQRIIKLFFVFLIGAITLRNVVVLGRQIPKVISNPQQVAFQYLEARGSYVYFPDQTLSALLARKTLFHSLDGLMDLSTANIPIDKAHLLAYVPRGMEYIALSPTFKWRHKYILRLFPEFSQEVAVEGLSQWSIYARKKHEQR